MEQLYCLYFNVGVRNHYIYHDLHVHCVNHICLNMYESYKYTWTRNHPCFECNKAFLLETSSPKTTITKKTNRNVFQKYTIHMNVYLFSRLTCRLPYIYTWIFQVCKMCTFSPKKTHQKSGHLTYLEGSVRISKLPTNSFPLAPISISTSVHPLVLYPSWDHHQWHYEHRNPPWVGRCDE